jgi:hypothetical protein
MQSFIFYCHILRKKFTGVLDEYIISIFRLEPFFPTCLLLVTCLAYFSAQKEQRVRFSETSAHFHRTALRFQPGDCNVHSYRFENIRSNIWRFWLQFYLLLCCFLFVCPNILPRKLFWNTISPVLLFLIWLGTYTFHIHKKHIHSSVITRYFV